MAKKMPVIKVMESLDEFFDSKRVNVFELGANLGNAPDYVQEGFFTAAVHYLSIVAQRGLDGDYVNSPTMELNSATARQMLGQTMD